MGYESYREQIKSYIRSGYDKIWLSPHFNLQTQLLGNQLYYTLYFDNEYLYSYNIYTVGEESIDYLAETVALSIDAIEQLAHRCNISVQASLRNVQAIELAQDTIRNYERKIDMVKTLATMKPNEDDGGKLV